MMEEWKNGFKSWLCPKPQGQADLTMYLNKTIEPGGTTLLQRTAWSKKLANETCLFACVFGSFARGEAGSRLRLQFSEKED